MNAQEEGLVQSRTALNEVRSMFTQLVGQITGDLDRLIIAPKIVVVA